ncbi:uncharacterized protein LOC128385807 [Panonychus citri]|uniref:uncharacterized protein LOC128385807 n=1 Tax=Panonychus citri TaxID=50023 RepID=UPI0023081E35|nr:uncharacterized protein LOC128385807 [Panonychus citri]
MFIKLIVLCLLPVSIFGAVKWQDCGQEDRSLVFKKLNFATEKITIDGKNPLKAEVDFDLLNPIDDNVQMDAILSRRFTVWGFSQSITIPCFNDAGSCSGQFCYFVQSYYKLARVLAEQLHVPFDCHMQPTTYAGNISYPVPPTAFENVPSIIANAISGTYELSVRWTSDDHEIGCLSVVADLEIDLE